MVVKLIEGGFVYEVEGYVLFLVNFFDGYGKFFCCLLDDMIVGVCVEVVFYKKDVGDFVLWKFVVDDEFGWDSFWGCGCFGWYLECFVMMVEYFGEIFDIYGGGVDLVFLYYENEIVQLICVYGGKVMVNYWLYNGFLIMGIDKMLKFLGNVQLVYDLVKEYLGEVLCYVLLIVYYWVLLIWMSDFLVKICCLFDCVYGVLC